MADLELAVKLITDPANVSRLPAGGDQERFSVKANKVIRGLRDEGAGKAEARELALRALDEVGGGAEVHPNRGPQGGARGNREAEGWWVPAEKIRF